ncbi:MAG: manganese efflux pump MntP family protein [Planctomycetia bacterium]|jgi:putative Mn2+ efflux pump MntP
MTWITLLGISIGLAMDAFAVSIAIGISLERVTPRHVFRVAFHFGLFQALMPLLGWFAGRALAEVIRNVDHWVAFALLVVLGARMLWEARKEPEEQIGVDPTRGWMLIMLSVATSIDALAVGLSMALLGVNIWVPAIVIGLVAAAFSFLGIKFGARLGNRWGCYAGIVGGIVLIFIGIEILVKDLWDI